MPKINKSRKRALAKGSAAGHTIINLRIVNFGGGSAGRVLDNDERLMAPAGTDSNTKGTKRMVAVFG